MTFRTYLDEVVPKAARNLNVLRRVEKLFDGLRVLKSCFNAYVLPILKYCAFLLMSSEEFAWVCWILLFAVRKGCVRVSFVAWSTEESQYLVFALWDLSQSGPPYEWLSVYVWLQLEILELQLLWASQLWWSRAAKLINLVGRLWLLLYICRACCRHACLVGRTWALFRAIWTEDLSLFFVFISVSVCCYIACLVSWPGL